MSAEPFVRKRAMDLQPGDEVVGFLGGVVKSVTVVDEGVQIAFDAADGLTIVRPTNTEMWVGSQREYDEWLPPFWKSPEAPPRDLRAERERLEREFLASCRRRRPDLDWHIVRTDEPRGEAS